MKKSRFEEMKDFFKSKGLNVLTKEYRNRDQKIECKNRDGYKVVISYQKLKAGRIPRPFSKHNPNTIENIKLFLEKENIPLKLLSNEFKSACNHKLRWGCEKGHVFESTWNNVQQGNRCPECAIEKNSLKQTYTLEKYIEKIKDIHGDKYEVVGEYTNTRGRVKIKCDCGNVWEPYAHSLLNGFGCKRCGLKKRSENRRKTQDEFEKEVFDLVGDEYTVIGEYTGSDNKIKFRHNKCGREYKVVPSSFISGKRCNPCVRKDLGYRRRKGAQDFIDQVWELVGNEYKVLTTDFELRSDKIKIKHTICGYKYKVTPQKFLSGRRCPVCRESAGEAQVRAYLEKEGYQFFSQYPFDDLYAEKRLRFDFVVFDGDRVLFAVEYDGEQHYRPVEFWGGEKGFKRQKKRDELKNDYCLKKGIPLIRIPYNSKDIFEELEKRILELNICV